MNPDAYVKIYQFIYPAPADIQAAKDNLDISETPATRAQSKDVNPKVVYQIVPGPR